jgi:hypothetical protein
MAKKETRRFRLAGDNEIDSRKLADLAMRLPLSDSELERLAEQMPRADELWFEETSNGWVFAVRIVRQGARPAIAELRIFPDEPLRLWPGRWSENPDDVPPGGVTSETVAAVRIGRIRDTLRSGDAAGDRVDVAKLNAPGDDSDIASLREEASQRPGEKGRSDTFYARLARSYVSEIEAGNPAPVATLARHLGKSAGVVRNMLRDARQRNLLTSTAPREAGGRLTSKAARLLAAKNA